MTSRFGARAGEGVAVGGGVEDAIVEAQHPRPHVRRVPRPAIELGSQDQIELPELRLPRNRPIPVVAVHVDGAIAAAGLNRPSGSGRRSTR